jgi:urease accessory protein
MMASPPVARRQFRNAREQGNIMVRTAFRLIAAVSVTLIAGPALAHTGVTPTSGFLAGFSHPMLGADHLLAMVAVGLWASQLGGRALWLVPGTFVVVMVLGGFVGMSGIGLPAVEFGILGSVVLLGLLVALQARLPVVLGMALVGLFALFHGHAHGTEMPADGHALVYAAGFVVATAGLHALGVAIGLLAARPMARLAGAITATAGLALAIG